MCGAASLTLLTISHQYIIEAYHAARRSSTYKERLVTWVQRYIVVSYSIIRTGIVLVQCVLRRTALGTVQRRRAGTVALRMHFFQSQSQHTAGQQLFQRGIVVQARHQYDILLMWLMRLPHQISSMSPAWLLYAIFKSIVYSLQSIFSLSFNTIHYFTYWMERH